MNLTSLLRCYFAAVRFPVALPANRCIGERMVLVAPEGALYLYAPGGVYSGPPLAASGESRVRFRIPGERPHYLLYRPDPDPARLYWNATDVCHIDCRDADYVEFEATPAGEAPLAILRALLGRSLEFAHATLGRVSDEKERRDPHLQGILAAARREAAEVVASFKQYGW